MKPSLRGLLCLTLAVFSTSAFACGTLVANGGLYFPLLPGPILGRGNAGIVTRVREADEHHFEKGYHDIKRGFDRETGRWSVHFKGRELRDFDAALMAHLRAEQKAGRELGVFIPETTPIETTIEGETLPGIRFEGSFDGRDVYSIVKDETLSAELREHVLKSYTEKLASLEKYFTDHCQGKRNLALMKGRFEEGGKYSLPFLEIHVYFEMDGGRNRVSTTLHITADGFIVDAATLNLHLVDAN